MKYGRKFRAAGKSLRAVGKSLACYGWLYLPRQPKATQLKAQKLNKNQNELRRWCMTACANNTLRNSCNQESIPNLLCHYMQQNHEILSTMPVRVRLSSPHAGLNELRTKVNVNVNVNVNVLMGQSSILMTIMGQRITHVA